MKNKERVRLCPCISSQDFDYCAKALKNYEFAELRGDLCLFSLSQVKKLIGINPHMVFTYRSDKTTQKTAEEQILTAVRMGVEFIDVEDTFSAKFIKEVRAAASKSGTSLIISHHDYEKTPPLATLINIYESAIKKGADIVKIAPTANSIADASTVLQLYHNDKIDRTRLIAFTMGESGRFSRITASYLGAPFVFCADDKPTAPGQFNYEQFKFIFDPDSYNFTIPEFVSSPKSTASIPCSKSVAQRAIIAAAIARGESILRNFEPCNDTAATIAFIRKCGCVVKVSRDGKRLNGEKMLIINSPGIQHWKQFQIANAGESGLLARILVSLIPYVSSLRPKTAVNSFITLTGEGTLMNRNFNRCFNRIEECGVEYKPTYRDGDRKNIYLPVTIGMRTRKKNNFTLAGDETSQIVSGSLMVLPLEKHDSVLTVTNPSSIPYIDLTLKILNLFGIKIESKRYKDKIVFNIKGGQVYTPADFTLESDWSSAANFMVIAAVASKMGGTPRKEFVIKNIETGTYQADEKILDILQQCGAKVQLTNINKEDFKDLTRRRFDTRHYQPDNLSNIKISADKLKGFETDVTNAPDLFAILTVLAIFCKGTSKIKGVHRLFNKESNRAETILAEVSKMGYNIRIEDDTMIVQGNEGKVPYIADTILSYSHNDHRIAMAAIIAGRFCQKANKGKVKVFRLEDIKCIDKSFPSFVKRLKLNE